MRLPQTYVLDVVRYFNPVLHAGHRFGVYVIDRGGVRGNDRFVRSFPTERQCRDYIRTAVHQRKREEDLR